jgi:hypothetical protein
LGKFGFEYQPSVAGKDYDYPSLLQYISISKCIDVFLTNEYLLDWN